jgi:hypothetical protein
VILWHTDADIFLARHWFHGPAAPVCVWWTTHSAAFTSDDEGEAIEGIVSTYEVEETETQKRWPLVGATWADRDQRGRLVFTRSGRLYAMRPERLTEEPILLADFKGQQPVALATPESARVWSFRPRDSSFRVRGASHTECELGLTRFRGSPSLLVHQMRMT